MRTRLVDQLPEGLWEPGNLRMRGRLHFCVDLDSGARTVEWNGQVIVSGMPGVGDETIQRFARE